MSNKYEKPQIEVLAITVELNLLNDSDPSVEVDNENTTKAWD